MANSASAQDFAASLPLADIHLPAEPGYWPLAWGWWACILAVLLTVAVLVYLVSQHRIKQRARKEALRQLKHLDDPAQFGNINLLLRQTAMSYYPRKNVAGLTGDQWLSFLDSHLAEKHRGFVSISEEWQRGIFSPQGLEPSAFSQCYKQASIWLKRAKLPASQEIRQQNSHHTNQHSKGKEASDV